MNIPTAITEDTDLERLYAQARAYELLTREQEQEIDARKWAAVEELQRLMLADPLCHEYLVRFIANCCRPLPEISQFPRRDQHFLLRRELGEYLPGGAQDKAVKRLNSDLRRPGTDDPTVTQRLLALAFPASLVVGIAELVRAQPDINSNDRIAKALQTWALHWPGGSPGAVETIDPATAEALAAQIDRYTRARNRLITHNLRLVYSIAGRNRNKGVAFIDLVQEGTLGLLRAAEKFQFEKGYRFSTYAFNWITQSIKRSVTDTGALIRYPGHVQEQLGRLYGERARQLARSGAGPGDSDLAVALGLSVDKTRELLQLRNLGVSLETPLFQDEEGTSLLDSIPGGPFPHTAAQAEQNSLQRYLLGEIRQLEPAEQAVVIDRWGLHQGPPLTRAEVADKMAVSREWVRQLERSALAKLGRSDVIRSVYEDNAQQEQ